MNRDPKLFFKHELDDKIDLLEIETGLFEARKLFERYVNTVYQIGVAMGSEGLNFLKKSEFETYAPLITSYFDYLFLMAERLNSQRKASLEGNSKAQKIRRGGEL